MKLCKIFNKHLGKSIKIKNAVLYLKKEERNKFCNKILDLSLKIKDILFIKESIMNLYLLINEKNKIIERKR